MFLFSRNVASSFAGCMGKTLRTNLFMRSTQAVFARSFFGGFGGNMGCRGNPVDRKYYDLLEVKVDATTEEIKQAFRKQAMKHHPDKGGNIEKFKQIKEAYDVLANDERRQIYDQLGPDGLQQTGDAGFNNYADLNDIFESIFGGGDGFSQRPTRTEDMVQRLPLTLDELYTGVKKDFAVTRNKICPDCKGLSQNAQLTHRVGTTKPNAVHRCPRCNGKGFVMQTTVVMGMMAQSRSVCPECGGEGSSINGKDKCKTCHGKKVRREREQMSVTIKPGMDHGQKVILRGAADQDPHLETGDIVFYIDQIEHPVFRRRGSDLFVRRNISLLQSLTGAEVTLDHLNGEKVTLRSEAGDILPPDCVRCVDDLGMPVYNAEGKFGKLYVQLHVQYPKGLTAKQMETLKQVLGEVEQGKESVKEEKEEVKEEKKEEKKETKKEEVKKKETKKEEVKKDDKKEETKKDTKKEETKDTKTETTPKTSVFSMKQCDQTIYGNKKLWDALFQ